MSVQKSWQERLRLRRAKEGQRRLKETRKREQAANVARKEREKKEHKTRCLAGMGGQGEEEGDSDEEDREWFRKEVGEEPDPGMLQSSLRGQLDYVHTLDPAPSASTTLPRVHPCEIRKLEEKILSVNLTLFCHSDTFGSRGTSKVRGPKRLLSGVAPRAKRRKPFGATPPQGTRRKPFSATPPQGTRRGKPSSATPPQGTKLRRRKPFSKTPLEGTKRRKPSNVAPPEGAKKTRKQLPLSKKFDAKKKRTIGFKRTKQKNKK